MKRRYLPVALIAALAVPLGIAEATTDSGTCEQSIPGLSLSADQDRIERELPKGSYAEASDERGRKVVCR